MRERGDARRVGPPDRHPRRAPGDARPQRGTAAAGVTSQPAAQDQVVSEGGAKVFIAPAAAPILDDKVLDIRVSEDKNRVQFVIGPQQGQPDGPG